MYVTIHGIENSCDTTAFEVHYKLFMQYMISSGLYFSNPLEGGIGFFVLMHTLHLQLPSKKITQSSKVEKCYNLLWQARPSRTLP